MAENRVLQQHSLQDLNASKPLLDSLFVLSESQCSIGWPLVPKCQIEWPPNCGKKVICKIRKIELSTFVRFPKPMVINGSGGDTCGG